MKFFCFTLLFLLTGYAVQSEPNNILLITPSVTIAITAGSQSICALGASITFTATPTNGGTSPAYQWQKNGTNVGTNSPVYTDMTLVNADFIVCVMTSNDPNAVPTIATSNRIMMAHGTIPTIQPVANQTFCQGDTILLPRFSSTTATYYNWTNNQPNIGLPAIGASSNAGTISAFVAANPTGVPITATITATPMTGEPEYAYITRSSHARVMVINTASRTIVDSISVGGSPHGISVSPNGSRVYVANQDSNTVSVISTATHNVIATIRVGFLPQGIVVSPDGNRVYVANSSSYSVSVINALTNTVIATIPVSANPYGITVSPNGSRVYVTSNGSNDVSVIETVNYTVLSTITVASRSTGIAISPDGSRLYVVNLIAHSLSVINTANNTIITTIPTDGDAYGIVVSPDGERVYLGQLVSGADNVAVINTATNTIITRIPAGYFCAAISISPDGRRVYAVNGVSNNISVINTTTNTVIETIQTGYSPSGFGNFIRAAQSGCAGTPTSFTVRVNPKLSPSVRIAITSGNATTCSHYNVTFTATPTNGGAAPTYQWYKNGTAIAGATNATYTGTNWLNNDFINCILTSNAVCRAYDRSEGIPITLTVRPTATITGPIAYCGSVTLTATGGNRYTWSGGNTPTSAQNVFTTSGNYTVTVTDTAGCSDTATRNVVVRPIPTIQSVDNQTICAGASTSPISFLGTSAHQYIWTNSDTTIGLPAYGTGPIPTFTAKNPTNSPITATITARPSKSTGLAYIPNFGSNTISVINTRTHTVVATIPVNDKPQRVYVSPDENRVYVTHAVGSRISVINTTIHAVIAIIDVNLFTLGNIAFSADGQWLYVNSVNAVYVINTTTNRVQYVITLGFLPLGTSPNNIVASPDGHYLYTVNNDNSFSVIHTRTQNAETLSSGWGGGPVDIAINPDGSRVYISNSSFQQIAVVNTESNLLFSTIGVDSLPTLMAMSPDGTRLYVLHAYPYHNRISVINTTINRLIGKINIQGSPKGGISVSSDGSQLYVLEPDSNRVQVVNTATRTVTTTISVGTMPSTIGNFIHQERCPSPQTATFTITVKSQPIVGFTSQLRTGSSSIIDFTNTSSGVGTVRWSFGDRLNSVSMESNPTFAYLENGTYIVKLFVTHEGCTDSLSKTLVITGVRSNLNEGSNVWKVRVVPNPISNYLSLAIEHPFFTLGNETQLIVTNGIGQRVYQSILNQNNIELDTQNWVDGIYNLMIYSNGRMQFVQKVVKIAP